jgi:arylsulfatase A-like enzyme
MMGTHDGGQLRSGFETVSVNMLAFAAWLGLLTGFGEVLLLGVKRLMLGRMIWTGPHVIWLAPLGNAILFVVVAGLLTASGRWLRSARAAVPYALVFLAVLNILLMYYPLHFVAKFLIAAGIAMQTVRGAARRPALFPTLVRRTTPVMMLFLVLFAVGVPLMKWFFVQRAVANLPASAPNAPNVLLVVMDTVRADHLSLHGYKRPTTPGLERFGRSSAMFMRATSTSPWTLPSHASLFTGRWPHEMTADFKSALDGTFPTLAEVLGRNGYVTAGFVANTYYCAYEFGLSRGFAYYDDYGAAPSELLVNSTLSRSVVNARPIRRLTGYHDTFSRKSALDITDAFLSWVDGVDRRPFFAFLNYFDAHEVYLPPAPFAQKFGPRVDRRNYLLIQDLRRNFRDDWQQRPGAEIDAEINSYDAAIAYLDSQLDRLFAQLEARNLLDNTLVVVTADHGEQFREHNLFVHGNSVYAPLLHVPLLIRYPRAVPPGRIEPRVSLRDVPSTILDLAGVADRRRIPGRSLARFWGSRSGSSDDPAGNIILSETRRADWGESWYPATRGELHSLMDDGYQYIRNGDGKEELYALDQDPLGTRDVSQSKGLTVVLERFRADLDRALKGSN